MSTARDFSSAIRGLMTVLDEGPPGLRAVYPAEKLTRIEALVEERREIGPESVRALMIALIEEQDPYALDHPFETPRGRGQA